MNALARGVTAMVAAVVVLASVTPFALVGTVAAATHTVDDSGGADFTTIQAAVNAAAPGDTIQVAPGTYAESVTVSKRLTIVGDPGGSAPGTGPDAPVLTGGPEGYGFLVTGSADGTTISGFDIRGYTDAAVSVELNGGGTLNGFELSHNDLTDNELEFEFFGASDMTISDVDVTSNRFVDSAGMIVDGSDIDGLTVSDFVFADNEMRNSLGDAVTILAVSTNTDVTMVFQGNSIENSDNDGLKFRLADSSSYDFTIEENVIDGSTDDAIDFFQNGGSGLTVHIEGNDLLNSGGNALDVRDGVGSGFTVLENNIDGNQKGIENDGTGVVDARNNYWGSSDGPSGSVADPVTGTIADGSGDSVSTDVRFDPFKSRPVGSSALSTTSGAQFELGDASFSTAPAETGVPVTISVPVTNVGDSTGEFGGMLSSDFTGHEVIELELEPGETAIARTTVVYSKAETYDIWLDHEYVGSLTVSPRDPMRVTVNADPANDTVDATVENPRLTGVDIQLPPMNATNESGVTLTSVQVVPEGVDDFELGITQSTFGENATNATDAMNVTNASVADMMMLPDGTAPVSAFVFESSLDNEDIESAALTFNVNTSRYPSLADAAVGDELSIYRYDEATGTFSELSGEVVETGNGSLTATVPLDGFSTYVLGADRAAFDVDTSVQGNPVAPGESVSLVFDVTNTGDGPGMFAPSVTMADASVESGSLALAAGESGQLVVELPTDRVGFWPVMVDDRMVGIAWIEADESEVG